MRARQFLSAVTVKPILTGTTWFHNDWHCACVCLHPLSVSSSNTHVVTGKPQPLVYTLSRFKNFWVKQCGRKLVWVCVSEHCTGCVGSQAVGVAREGGWGGHAQVTASLSLKRFRPCTPNWSAQPVKQHVWVLLGNGLGLMFLPSFRTIRAMITTFEQKCSQLFTYSLPENTSVFSYLFIYLFFFLSYQDEEIIN